MITSPTGFPPTPYHFLPPMTDPIQLSPAAQAVKDAVLATYADNIPKDKYLWALERASTVAALRAAAVVQPEIDLPLSKVMEWEQIEGVCTSYYAAAKWGYEQALAHINTIATELENQ